MTIERRFIKIRGNSIYVKNKLHGLVQDSKFCLATDINNLSTNVTQEADTQPGTFHTTLGAASSQITPNPDSELMQTTTLSSNDPQGQMEYDNANR